MLPITLDLSYHRLIRVTPSNPGLLNQPHTLVLDTGSVPGSKPGSRFLASARVSREGGETSRRPSVSSIPAAIALSRSGSRDSLAHSSTLPKQASSVMSEDSSLISGVDGYILGSQDIDVEDFHPQPHPPSVPRPGSSAGGAYAIRPQASFRMSPLITEGTSLAEDSRWVGMYGARLADSLV